MLRSYAGGKDVRDIHLLWRCVLIIPPSSFINNRHVNKNTVIRARCSEKHKYPHMSAHFSKKVHKNFPTSRSFFSFLKHVLWYDIFNPHYGLALVPLISATRDWVFSDGSNEHLSLSSSFRPGAGRRSSGRPDRSLAGERTVHTYSLFLPQQMVVVEKVLPLAGSKFSIFSMVIVSLWKERPFQRATLTSCQAFSRSP